MTMNICRNIFFFPMNYSVNRVGHWIKRKKFMYIYTYMICSCAI